VKPLDVHRLKFIDESGTTLAMIRRYGRATPGHRVVDHVPENYGVNYTMLAARGLDELHAPWGGGVAVNGDIVRWWVRRARLLRLSPYLLDFNPFEQCWS
jgi:hypothetical protein